MAYLQRINAMGVTLPHKTNRNLTAWVLDCTASDRGVSVQLYTGDTLTRKMRKPTRAAALAELDAHGYDTDPEIVNQLMIPKGVMA